MLEKYELEQIEIHNKEENEKWITAEVIAIEKYKKIEEDKEKQRQSRLEIELKIQHVSSQMQRYIQFS